MNTFWYNLTINGEEIYSFEQGFTLNRNWEEALDDGFIKIVLSNREEPFKPNSFLRIDGFCELKDGTIEEKTYEYLITSDVVDMNNKYGYYNHNLNLIEYTAKLDYYMMNTFSLSKNIYEEGSAYYDYVLDYKHYPRGTLIGDLTYPINANAKLSDGNSGNMGVLHTLSMPKLLVNGKGLKQQYNIDETLTFQVEKTNGSYYSNNVYIKNWVQVTTSSPDEVETFLAPTYIKVNGFKYAFRDKDKIDLPLSVGKNEIYFGVEMPEQEYLSTNSNNPVIVPKQDVDVIKYYVDIKDEEHNSLYDVIMLIRDGISKYGGIESKKYFNNTRLFNLSDEDAIFLKKIESPQIFLPSATIRQMLSFVLTYVNALPRVFNDKGVDRLELEYYNNIQGLFELEGTMEELSDQNSNQIGSRTYSELKNILPNDLSNPTVILPSKSGFTTVRSENVQLTDDSFELPLVDGKPLYKPIKLTLNHSVRLGVKDKNFNYQYHYRDIELDLTNVWINKGEWDTKLISDNFPRPYWSKMYGYDVGFNNYRTENLWWNKGDKSIKFSEVNGQMEKTTLLQSVIISAINRELTKILNEIDNNKYWNYVDVNYNMDFQGINWFKDLKFNVEYITDENMVIKQDKEDLSEVDFYSEMRNNQDETTINLARASRKAYGDLQRTGNVGKSFMKRHFSFNDMYDVGQVDSNGYVITSMVSTYYNFFIDTVYTITKNHNRISQATFIDQTYRWRDNYADQVIDRNEPYNDYVFLIPSDKSSIIEKQETKIVNDDINNKTFQVMFSNLGLGNNNELPDNTKATLAFVRTDGYLDELKRKNQIDTTLGGRLNTRQLVTTVSSAGFKQGLVFKFGFNNNQLAGSNLKKVIYQLQELYFNEPIKYTNYNGTFKYLDFNILNDYDMGDNGDFPSREVMIENNYDYFKQDTNITYFSTGKTPLNDMANDSLIVNKDVMSNINISYAVNIMSYYQGLFIFGNDFYRLNSLVTNLDKDKEMFLYLYNNDTTYNIFEDLRIKEGYKRKINNKEEGFISYNNSSLFLDYPDVDITSWAIGDEYGNLYLACNDNIEHISIIQTHHRPNVQVIGEFFKYFELDFASIIKVNSYFEYVYSLNPKPVDLNANINVSSNIEYEHSTTVYNEFKSDMLISSIIDYSEYLNEAFEFVANLMVGANLDYVSFINPKPEDYVGNINLTSSFDYTPRPVQAPIYESFKGDLTITSTLDYATNVNSAPFNGTWQFEGDASTTICRVNGFNLIGTSCSIENQRRVVNGRDIGLNDACYTVVCKK